MERFWREFSLGISLSLGVAFLLPLPANAEDPTVSPYPTPFISPDPTMTPYPTPDISPDPTMTPYPTPDISPDPTMTPYPTPDISPYPTMTPYPTPTISPFPTPDMCLIPPPCDPEGPECQVCEYCHDSSIVEDEQAPESSPDPSYAVCGDGSVNLPAEQCDDGNVVNGDGCSELCQYEE